jgi:hypothetical protein
LLYQRTLVLAPGRFNNFAHLRAELIRGTVAQLPVEELKESNAGPGLFCLAPTPGTDPINAIPVAELALLVRKSAAPGLRRNGVPLTGTV